MDTHSARIEMLGLARRAVDLEERYATDEETVGRALLITRELIDEARGLLADAGYPGQPVWNALQHMFFALGFHSEPLNAAEWDSVKEDLLAARNTLDDLLNAGKYRDSDFRVVS